MRGCFLAVAVGLLGILPGSSRTADAAPMSTSLAELRVEAATIIIGTMVPGADLTVDVDKVVRGPTQLGPRKVRPSPDGHASVGGRVVAFLDRSGAFRWVGRLAAGPTLETGVLHLSGFFDWNAHLVSPGLMTLAQLETFLATGTLVQTFAATISVQDAKGVPVPSGHTFTITHDPLARTTTVAGFTGACLGNGRLEDLDLGIVTVELSSTCPRTPGAPPPSGARDRRLELRGNVIGVDGHGAIAVDLSPVRPLLEARDFSTFVNDPSIASVKRLVDVKLDDGTTWTWDLGTALVDPAGVVHRAGGIGMSSQGVDGVTTETRSYEFGEQTVILGPRRPVPSTPGEYASILQRISQGTTGPCTFSVHHEPPQGCTLGRGRSVLVKR